MKNERVCVVMLVIQTSIEFSIPRLWIYFTYVGNINNIILGMKYNQISKYVRVITSVNHNSLWKSLYV